MGQPILTIKSVRRRRLLFTGLRVRISPSEYIALVKRTQGTETSQYLEERTSTETPLVVASERGPGQCLFLSYQNRLESRAVVGESPVWEGERRGFE